MATVRIEGVQDEVPVEKILCLGRNYRAHAEEMGSDIPVTPVVFLKPPTALIDEDDQICLPRFSNDIHHEIEMVVLIGITGKDIPRAEAMDYVSGYGVGLDLTARDVQSAAKKNGLPWAVAKGFDGSAPVSRFIRPAHVPDPHALDLTLKVNGIVRQHANTSLMIFRIDEVISYLSTIFTLSAGDLIFTGTPEGVGRLVVGDRLDLALGDIVTACFEVGAT
jgi:2-keto-4-pentenoate hydratase/2-oxohepta-3-ene-1,7-dioic acid hydratase in catechol pathway